MRVASSLVPTLADCDNDASGHVMACQVSYLVDQVAGNGAGDFSFVGWPLLMMR